MSTSRPISDEPNDSHNSEEASPPLSYLPDDVRHLELYPRSPLGVLGLLAQTSHQYETETAFLRLLHSTLDAEPVSYEQADETKLAAIAILKKHPELLFKTGRVIDHFGRNIKASPYQLLLGAGDVWALKQVHEEILPKIENGKARAEDEFRAQFPDYNGPWPLAPNMPEEALYDKRNKEQIAQVTAQLKIIVEKIKVDPCTNASATKDETTEAIADLCKIFAPKEGEIIKTGLHFPLGILTEIGKVYDAQFVPWSVSQLAFFSREVIGGALAALTAVDGQCVKKGLTNLNMDKGPDRSDGLFCRYPKGIPVDKAPLVGKLGRTMFVDPYDGYSCFVSSTPGSFDWYNKNGRRGLVSWGSHRPAVAAAWSPLLVCRVSVLENLWKTKAEAYGSYYAAEHREVNTLSK